jgi:uncharacterized repeat protein (TIGR03803 family)
MKILTTNRASLGISAGIALLAACGGSQPPIGAPGAMPQASGLVARTTSTNYKVVYSFGAAPDGNNPAANLIDVDGILYGTTLYGGAYGSCIVDSCGTVFSITTGGTEQVLHSFNGKDGFYALAGLTDVGGTLYGTTGYGGAHGRGTVFSITTGGMEKVVHSFGRSTGHNPFAGLIDVGGTLYGTTGRPVSSGIVFSMTPSGRKKVLHKFGSPDGVQPLASLIYVNGTLYGTTVGGGAYGGGTVFSVTPGGTERVLHSFSGKDGEQPQASLIDVDGTFYGTTQSGGAQGRGTVFTITPSGTERVLYSFRNGPDGMYPYASLIALNGKLYGTTELGGGYYTSYCHYNGCGTAFSITPGGKEKVLHSFNGPDGAFPLASLVNVNGTLYGTTDSGGTFGNGTVFALTP